MIEFDITQYVNHIGFIISSFLGGVAHWLKKVAKKETDASFAQWLGKDNWAGSIYTLIVFAFTIIGALAGDLINQHTGFWAALFTGFMTGIAVDSSVNSNAQHSITDQLIEVKKGTKELFIKEKINRDESTTKQEPVKVIPSPSEARPRPVKTEL